MAMATKNAIMRHHGAFSAQATLDHDHDDERDRSHRAVDALAYRLRAEARKDDWRDGERLRGRRRGRRGVSAIRMGSVGLLAPICVLVLLAARAVTVHQAEATATAYQPKAPDPIHDTRPETANSKE
jgi:hypothetical protein